MGVKEGIEGIYATQGCGNSTEHQQQQQEVAGREGKKKKKKNSEVKD